MKNVISILFLGVALLQNGIAATSTSTMQSSATINASCNISADNVSFGDLTASGSPSMSWTTGNIRALCTRNASYSIQINYGNNVDANNYRQMKGATTNSYIKYTVCKTQKQDLSDAEWGIRGGCVDPWRGTQYTTSSSGTGISQVFPVYILSQKNYYTPDNYSDNLTATIVY